MSKTSAGAGRASVGGRVGSLSDFQKSKLERIPRGRLVSAQSLGLSPQELPVGGRGTRQKTIHIDEIRLGRGSLNPQRLLQLNNTLPGSKISRKGKTAIHVIRNAQGKYVVTADGNHRVAFLKLTHFKGKIPVTITEKSK